MALPGVPDPSMDVDLLLRSLNFTRFPPSMCIQGYGAARFSAAYFAAKGAVLPLLTNPATPQSSSLVTRPPPCGGFSSLIRNLTLFPFTSTRVYPKNQPSSYFLDARRCPPELAIETYITPSRSACSIW